MNNKQKAAEIFRRLEKRYPAPEPALDWTNAWELLVATVLAAQCTDERVNKVTPGLFARWPSIPDMAAADVSEVEEAVRSTGFFRNKAKNLVASARLVMEEFQGQVPRSMADLVRLPGVARKTANIVLSNAYGVHEGIAVDTHVKRPDLPSGPDGEHRSRAHRKRPHAALSARGMGRHQPFPGLFRPRGLQGAETALRRMRARRPLSEKGSQVRWPNP